MILAAVLSAVLMMQDAPVPTPTPAPTPASRSEATPATPPPESADAAGDSSAPTSAQPQVQPERDTIKDDSLLDTLGTLKWPETASEWESVLILLGKRVLLPLVGALLVLVIAFFVAKRIHRATERALTRAKVEVTLSRFLAKVASWFFIGLVLLTILSTVGVNITSFAALLGAGGLAIGLALQGALTNLSAGVMLLIFRPYRIGDMVRLDGELGTVADIELFTTRLDTPDNRRIILPNSKIYGNKIENLTKNPLRRVDLLIPIAYKNDFELTRKVMEAALARIPTYPDAPAPAASAAGFGDSCINWEMRIWCPVNEVGQVRHEAIAAVKQAFAEHEIESPFSPKDLQLGGTVSVALLNRA